ncbi:hypothetical protein Vadar_017965 [Vaccinium darrowii]|uniref:Uncharacterized protein n=1 Tax=Vaccinium darrowii TaxID=229202 RepID=A0ACB7YNP0_9ERIC|nr:hypothetical protein Vadar_017965 [Vaccinium darrowii]
MMIQMQFDHESMSTALQDKCSFSLLDHATLDSVGDNNLIRLVYGGMLLEKSSGSQNCITFIGTGKQCPLLISTYVILYETPIFGSHYFSVGIRRSEQIKDPLKKPRTLQLCLINNILAFQVSIMCGICGESSLHKHSTCAIFMLFGIKLLDMVKATLEASRSVAVILWGRKLNPLRQRYDSYDYTVEQHIVGSLLFTPLLLLLPTTSVFYIFFTIMKSTISFICLAIDIVICMVHATPYIKILLWLVRPSRFPCGIWFEVINCLGDDPLGTGGSSDASKTSEKLWKRTDISRSRSRALVSFLLSNFLNIGEALSYYFFCCFATYRYGCTTGKVCKSSIADNH